MCNESTCNKQGVTDSLVQCYPTRFTAALVLNTQYELYVLHMPPNFPGPANAALGPLVQTQHYCVYGTCT